MIDNFFSQCFIETLRCNIDALPVHVYLLCRSSSFDVYRWRADRSARTDWRTCRRWLKCRDWGKHSCFWTTRKCMSWARFSTPFLRPLGLRMTSSRSQQALTLSYSMIATSQVHFAQTHAHFCGKHRDSTHEMMPHDEMLMASNRLHAWSTFHDPDFDCQQVTVILFNPLKLRRVGI